MYILYLIIETNKNTGARTPNIICKVKKWPGHDSRPLILSPTLYDKKYLHEFNIYITYMVYSLIL